MLRNVGRAVIVKGGKDSSLDCALFNTYRRSKEPSEEKGSKSLRIFTKVGYPEGVRHPKFRV